MATIGATIVERVMPMKTIPSAVIATALAALIASAPAMAQHRGHHHSGGGARFSLGIGIGLGFGLPYYAYRPPYYYYPPYPPYYYYPPVVVAPAPPPVYVERQDVIREQFIAPIQQPQLQQPQAQHQAPAQAQAEARIAQGDWFYCADSKTYYPYVQQCAGQWQRVTPQPPTR